MPAPLCIGSLVLIDDDLTFMTGADFAQLADEDRRKLLLAAGRLLMQILRETAPRVQDMNEPVLPPCDVEPTP